GTGDKELTDFIENDPEIKNAHNEYEKFLSDEHLQHLYLAREMYQHDEATRIATAKEEGIGIGIGKGTIQKEKQIALYMHKNGFSAMQISEITGLDIKRIRDYLSE
ncbi:MAG: hypothetical protein JW874_06090, partial [Spirochaetales bacterium]|nr:hypothetical protein [Spirochaetales bacterium]